MAQFTNQAQLLYNNTVVNSNVAVGEITDPVSGTKTALINTYARDDDVTYIISVVNNGTTPLPNLSVSDDLGQYTVSPGVTATPLTYTPDSARVYIDGVLQPAPTVTPGPPLVFSGIALPAGSNLMIVYEAAVNGTAPLATDGAITNTATVNGTGAATPLTLSETVTAEAAPNLMITKSIDPVPVADNGTLTYTFVIQNYGNTAATADDDVILTDTFDPLLRNVTATLNGAALAPAREYTYNPATGVFSTISGVITVPPATFTQDPATGSVLTTPGVTTVTATGTL